MIAKSRFSGSQRRKDFFIYVMDLKVLVRLFHFQRGEWEGKSSQVMQQFSVIIQEGISFVGEMQLYFFNFYKVDTICISQMYYNQAIKTYQRTQKCKTCNSGPYSFGPFFQDVNLVNVCYVQESPEVSPTQSNG